MWDSVRDCVILAIKANIGNLIIGLFLIFFIYYPIRLLGFNLFKGKNLRKQKNLTK